MDEFIDFARQAVKRLEDIYDEQQGPFVRKDAENWHQEADDVLVDLLLNIGLVEVVEAYNKIGKWFA